MSLNLSFAYVPSTTVSALGFVGAERATFDAATSSMSDGASAAQFGEHVIIVDPTSDLLINPPAGATIVSLSGVSDTYVLQTTDEDPRLLVHVEGEEVESQGTPLAAEAVLDDQEFREDGFMSVFFCVSHASWDDLNRLDWRQGSSAA